MFFLLRMRRHTTLMPGSPLNSTLPILDCHQEILTKMALGDHDKPQLVSRESAWILQRPGLEALQKGLVKAFFGI